MSYLRAKLKNQIEELFSKTPDELKSLEESITNGQFEDFSCTMNRLIHDAGHLRTFGFSHESEEILNIIEKKPADSRLVFLKSWNEWGEGNYMEPDLIWGNQYLDTLKELVLKYKKEQ